MRARPETAGGGARDPGRAGGAGSGRGGRRVARLLLLAAISAGCGPDARTPSGPAISLSAAGSPAALSHASGNGQAGAVGRQLLKPLAVKVKDAAGAAVKGVAVTFVVTAGGGSLSTATANSNASGVASTQLTLGAAAGANAVRASVPGLPPLDFTATARVPDRLVVTGGAGQTGAAGMELPAPLAVKVVDAAGDPVPAVPVQWVVTAGGGSVKPGSSKTLADGVATTELTLGGAAGANAVEARSGGLATVALSATGRVPAEIRIFAGDFQSANVTATLSSPIVARVVDAAGEPVPGVPLSFRITYNVRGSKVLPAGVITNAAGKGSAKWTLAQEKGINQAEAYIAVGPYSGLHPATFNATGLFSWGTVAAGLNHTCGIAHNGTAPGLAYCWGWNLAGAVGDGTTTDRNVPTLVASGSLAFTAITAGTYHTCGLLLPAAGGNASCWGGNSTGQLGTGDNVDAHLPAFVTGGRNYTALAAGAYHTCGLVADGSAYCWGKNTHGQLGDGTTTERRSPVRVGVSGALVALAAGVDFTCGLQKNGTLLCWGANNYGQLGNATVTPYSLTPTPVAPGTVWKTVGAGQYHACAGVAKQGDLYCWGRNDRGQLGLGGTAGTPVPTRVGTFTARQIDGGGAHTCVITPASYGYCWGSREFGQVGDGVFGGSSTPYYLGVHYATMQAGSGHSCGARGSETQLTVNELYCWGMNSSGQLGTGSTLNRAAPARVIEP